MRPALKFWRRVHALLNRRRFEQDLAEEMDAHREMMAPGERRRFGNDTRLREESREQWSWSWLDQFRQDLNYGVRTLLKAPAFTLGAIAVLALGVGVNLAEFEIFDAMIFHRLNIRDVEEFIQFSRISKEGQHPGFPSAAVEFYRAGSANLAWLVSEDTSFEMVVDDQAGVRSSLVSANYFSSLGIVPAWGRLLDARDSEPGASAVAVLGYQEWQTHWAARPEVVGQVIHVNGKPVQIVGVAPYTFEGLSPRRIALWLPTTVRPQLFPGSPAPNQDYARPSAALFGRLKPGASQAAAEAELTALTRELMHSQPHAFRPDDRIQAQLLQASMRLRARQAPAIAIFMGLILLVLLSACANLGNMLLARGLARQREITIRLSLGASRGRVVRQLMTENFVLALLGAAAGLAFGSITARLLMRLMDAPPGMLLTLNWPILTTALVLTGLSAVAFGLPAALQTARPNQRKMHLRQSLVGIQVAISCLLLIVSGVLAHNGIASAAVNLSFDYQKMLIVDPQFYARTLPPAVALQKLDALSAGLSSLPGVASVTAAVVPPLGGRVMLENVPGLPRVYRNAVLPSYFAAINLPIVRGRTFLPGEPNVVVVSETSARTIWRNEDPVGKTWDLAGRQLTVAGVVKDSGANLLADPDSIEAYTPLEGADVQRATLIVRTYADPAPLIRQIPGAAATAGESVSITLMRTSRENQLAAQARLVTLFGSIGMVATALAAAGMFALVAFAVAQRKRELGIRIAIGAGPRHVLSVLLLQNAWPTAIGAASGVALAIALSLLIRSLVVLQSRESFDMLGFSAGLACFLAVAAAATLVPATRALRIDPSATLREE